MERHMKKSFTFALWLGACLSVLLSQSANAVVEEQVHICMDRVREWYVTLPFEAFSEQVRDAYGSVHLWPLEEQTEYYQMMGSDAHQLPDEHEIPQQEACRIALEYLIDHGVASAEELNAFEQGASYLGKALIGWTILWIDEQDQIIWQVALEKYTGHVLEWNETITDKG